VTALLRAEDGTIVELDLDRWHDTPNREELELLDRVRAPVIDLGCGPGRHVVALGHRGVPALGVDAAPAAVARARARGALVLERSVFERLPGANRWGTVLLLDGNIGIGGDPASLLDRAARLLRSDGIALVELGPPGTATRSLNVRMERDAARSAPFPWAVVGVDAIDELAGTNGLRVDDQWERGGRWFSQLAIG
jgi:SAM-dependent methyltransferase